MTLVVAITSTQDQNASSNFEASHGNLKLVK